MKRSGGGAFPVIRLALLTAAALIIHGYHLGVEDAEIYIPAARKLLDPRLYPYANEFFMSHARMSAFGAVLAAVARLTHLSMDWTMFLLYIATLFAMLVACWTLANVCFHSSRARWCSVLAVAAVMTMPATNTGLLLMDPYLTARSFSTPLILLALAALLRRRYAYAVIATLAAGVFHPQMTACFLVFACVMRVAEKSTVPLKEPLPALVGAAAVLPFQFDLVPAQGPYREALYARGYFFLSNWTWYHWLGMLAPLAILAWISRRSTQTVTPESRLLSSALVPFGLISIAVAAIFTSSHKLDMFARVQPLRSFHLITLIFVLLFGGLIGHYAGKRRSWMLSAMFLCLAGGMFIVNRDTYPFSPHIEVPWATTSPNAWVNTLLWIRTNTPQDAVFAVDARYFKQPGVDVHGFRAVSERSSPADYFKDGGVAAMFPALADEWKTMSNATYGLDHFNSADFARLATQYPVTWAVIHGVAPAGMACPYQQGGYAVCKI
jgi:hypothetical protein